MNWEAARIGQYLGLPVVDKNVFGIFPRRDVARVAAKLMLLASGPRR
jgi:hypothetical protein